MSNTISRFLDGSTMSNKKKNVEVSIFIGKNQQPTKVGKEKYPKEEFPLAWFIGFDNNEVEFASKIRDAYRAKFSDVVLVQDSSNSIAHYFTIYIKSIEALEKFVRVIFRGENLLLEKRYSISGRSKKLKPKDIIEEAKKKIA